MNTDVDALTGGFTQGTQIDVYFI